VALPILALTACGGAGAARNKAIVRVANSDLPAATLDHWIALLAPQHVVPTPPGYTACIARLSRLTPHSGAAQLKSECERQRRALVQRALDFLIAGDWLTGEASHLGVGVSNQEVAQGLARRKRTFPNGEVEFGESLKAIGYTPPDVELEVELELAAENIRRSLQRSEPGITQGQVAAYYARNIRRYLISERRRIYIAENLKGAAAARRLVAEVNRGKSLAEVSLDESFQRREIVLFQGEKRTILEAIFAATPHVVAKPVELNHLYFVFEVTHVTPTHLESLASVSRSIARQLADEQRRRTLAGFISTWRRKWIAQTDCSAGYVVQKCRQYTGPIAPEDPLELR
jgi:hypothetical protein